jgi:hypothetical protein
MAMTTAKRTQPKVLELDVVLATVVVVVVELDVVVVGCTRVVVVAGSVVVVVGAVVGGTVVVVVGATVVVVTGAVVVVVSWAPAVPDKTPSSIGALAMARSSAAVRRETFESISAAYGQWPARQGTIGAPEHEKPVGSRFADSPREAAGDVKDDRIGLAGR